MRPRLHPEMGSVVICARVAIQLVYLNYRTIELGDLEPRQVAEFTAASLPLDYPGMLRLALHSLAVYLDLRWTSLQWLESVLRASHFGHSFRRCFFFDYKDNRSPYPRVTNRGVQTSPKRRANNRRLGFGDE